MSREDRFIAWIVILAFVIAIGTPGLDQWMRQDENRASSLFLAISAVLAVPIAVLASEAEAILKWWDARWRRQRESHQP